MRASGTIAIAIVFLLVSTTAAQSQARRSPAGAAFQHQGTSSGTIRAQQQLLIGPRLIGPRSSAASGTSQSVQGSLHLDLHVRARPLVFPTPAPTKSPDYNPLILRREA